jgi:hypothetical protein
LLLIQRLGQSLDDATLTVPLNSSKTVTLTAEQVKVKDFS